MLLFASRQTTRECIDLERGTSRRGGLLGADVRDGIWAWWFTCRRGNRPIPGNCTRVRFHAAVVWAGISVQSPPHTRSAVGACLIAVVGFGARFAINRVYVRGWSLVVVMRNDTSESSRGIVRLLQCGRRPDRVPAPGDAKDDDRRDGVLSCGRRLWVAVAVVRQNAARDGVRGSGSGRGIRRRRVIGGPPCCAVASSFGSEVDGGSMTVRGDVTMSFAPCGRFCYPPF